MTHRIEEPYGASPLLATMSPEAMDRLINPPITWIVMDDGTELIVPLDWTSEQRARRVRSYKRRRAALKGWATRRRKAEV